jgi:nucleoside-diphosphate-sugar epimerase
MRIFLTGSSGFIGRSLIDYLGTENIVQYKRGENLNFDSSSIIIHLSAIAHDLKKITSPDQYYQVNTEFTKEVFDTFLNSNSTVFITLSSVKAVADSVCSILDEKYHPKPSTHYGISKLLAEQYILSKEIPVGKRVYILRPCMVHGPGNKGNLNILYKFLSKNIPWPLGAFNNERSFCSIDNLIFVINKLICKTNIPSGIYNVADDTPLSTNEIINIISKSKNRSLMILHVPKIAIYLIARIGDILRLPLNSERLQKLTQNYIVSNRKLIKAMGEELPVNSRDGMVKTINSFNN